MPETRKSIVGRCRSTRASVYEFGGESPRAAWFSPAASQHVPDASPRPNRQPPYSGVNTMRYILFILLSRQTIPKTIQSIITVPGPLYPRPSAVSLPAPAIRDRKSQIGPSCLSCQEFSPCLSASIRVHLRFWRPSPAKTPCHPRRSAPKYVHGEFWYTIGRRRDSSAALSHVTATAFLPDDAPKGGK
jgi:hypothetical protein